MEFYAENNNMGTILYPYYKGKCKGIEYGTGVWNQSKWKYDPFSGFTLPYKGSNAFITFKRANGEIYRDAPNYEIVNIDKSVPLRMNMAIEITKDIQLKPVQKAVINRIISDTINDKWFINLQTGEGKTLISIILSQLYGYKTFIMCFNSTILSQWASTFCKFTNIDKDRIIKLTSADLTNILDNDESYDKYDIFMCTPTLLDRFAKTRKDYSTITTIFNRLGIGLSIFDEAHRNVSNLVKISALTSPKYRIFLSADFGQGNYEKESQFKEIFNNIPVISADDDNNKLTMKYTKLVMVEFNSQPGPLELKAIFRLIRGRFMYNANNYLKYQEKKGTLNKCVYYILDSILKKDTNHKILILYSNIATVEKVGKELKEKYPDMRVGSFYGKIPNDEKENIKNNSNIIVATYSSFSTGVDAYNIKYILSTNQCNKIEDNQSAGRARPLADGSDAVYFMFIDNGFDYCKKKVKERLKYLTETKSKDSKVYRIMYK